mmetsp:Transcript_14937/g.51951  ORF Transcript_14937/g.51951 Transcript_14937/m.51951 type:complete len:186 (+) Transcript_14937:309-866(+)
MHRAIDQSRFLGRLFPSFGVVRDVAALALLPMDGALSPAGLAQVAAQRKVLDARRFAASHRVQLVVHSHYARARDTARGLFEGALDEHGAAVRLIAHAELYEQGKYERVFPSALSKRTAGFTQWLLDQPQERIVVVGHSLFFEAATGVHLGNCAVWRANLGADAVYRDLEVVAPTPAAAAENDTP